MKKKAEESSPALLSREQVRAFDAWAIRELGIPGVVLMENAGRGCACVIEKKLSGKDSATVLVLCGTGNNGGDGYVIARHLLNAGHRVTPVLCGDREKVQGDALLHLTVLERMVGTIPSVIKETEEFLLDGPQDLIVDALLGTGLQGSLRPPYDSLIAAINETACPVVAVDIPSGLDCNTGRPLGNAVRAQTTVTFVAQKVGFAKKEARQYTGRVVVASIGIEPTYWSAHPL